ncbi:MAG: phosphate ABC transporter substrate-binding protein PstS [Acidimicrobiales bacterium]
MSLQRGRRQHRWTRAGAGRRVAVATVALALTAAACAGEPVTSGGLTPATLNASGATFPKVFYEETILEFGLSHPEITVNYAGGGSGKGRTDLQERQVDFAGSDAPVKAEDVAKYQGGEFVYIPTITAPITVSFNLDDLDELRLAPETIAGIFERDITRWDDPAVAADNPGVELPDTDITVVRRSDGSGTTENFTKFLVSAAGERWSLGSGSTVEWPSDTQGAQGNAGIAGLIQATDGAIGYVDYSDAVVTGLSFAAVRNRSGAYVLPSPAATSAALAATTIEEDLTYDPIDADGPDAYPIAAPTWILVYVEQGDRAKAEALKAFLRFLLTDGQRLAPEIDYAPLPDELVGQALAQLDRIEVPA